MSLDFSQADAGVHFDPGFSVQAVGGYRFCPCFGLEAETGLAYNLIHSINGSSSTGAEFSQIPVMFNAAFQWPCCAHVVPYAGLGLGISADYLNISHATVQGFNVSGDGTAITFAGQALLASGFPSTTTPGWISATNTSPPASPNGMSRLSPRPVHPARLSCANRKRISCSWNFRSRFEHSFRPAHAPIPV